MDKLYIEFWDSLLRHTQIKKTQFNLSRSNIGRYYYGFSLGAGNAEIVFTAPKTQHHIGCQLYLKGEDSKKIFIALEKSKSEIEKKLLVLCDWQFLEDKNDCRIITTKDADIYSRVEWEKYFRWYVALGERFIKVFSAHIKLALQSTGKDTVLIKKSIQLEDETLSFYEGKEKFVLHRKKERDSKVGKQAKKKRLKETGELICDCCGFSFLKTYGTTGKGFIEAHHTIPISSIVGERETKIEEIALVCSNCHRMLHRGNYRAIVELQKIIEKNKKQKVVFGSYRTP